MHKQTRVAAGLLGGLFGGFLLCATVVADATPPVVRYDGHKVVRAIVEGPDQLQVMGAISPDCWCEGDGDGVNDWRVPPDKMAALDASGIAYTIVIENVQARVDAERSRLAAPPADGAGWYDDFKNLDAINTRLDELDAASPIAEIFSIGNTIEGRPIRGLKITSAVGSDKPAVLYNATQHAREWIAPMTAMFIAEAFIDGYGGDPEITEILDTTEVYVIPVVNPDGYVYAWGPDRYWRKNRRNNGDGTSGVDLNRNWAFGWGGGGSSGNTNDPTYRGPAPFSEPETLAMRDFYNAHQNLVLSIDFHSYGQWVLYPWAYTGGGPGDDGEHALVGDAMADAILAVHGRDYVDGPVFETLYQASGGSVDWTYGDQTVISYTIELRGNDFVIDPDQIIPTGEENLEAALTLASYADDYALPIEFGFPNGLPSTLEPGAATIVAVEVTQGTGGPINTASGILQSRVGDSGPFSGSDMTYLGDDLYEATLPAVPCGNVLQYYFEVESMSGTLYSAPDDAPLTVYEATATEQSIAFADDFQSDLGWTVESMNLDDGAWERGVPAGAGDRGDPLVDFDGSGACYLTDNVTGNSDVDGGPTLLTSPVVDLSASDDPHLTYARWFTSTGGAPDELVVEISNNGGGSWTLIESAGHSTGWTERDVRIADFLAPTATMVVRFNASDNPNDSVTEAAIDAVQFLESGCPGGNPGDVNGDGVVNFQDILLLLAAWGPCGGCPEDLNDDGVVNFADVLIALGNWG